MTESNQATRKLGEIMSKGEHRVSDMIKAAEVNLHKVRIKSESAYIDQDCSGSVKDYCNEFTSKKTGDKKDYQNHYKLVPVERLVIDGYNGRKLIAEVTHEVK